MLPMPGREAATQYKATVSRHARDTGAPVNPCYCGRQEADIAYLRMHNALLRRAGSVNWAVRQNFWCAALPFETGRVMNVARSAPSNSRRDDEARRYQRAAEDALVQLEWCIGYLDGIGETKASRALSRNHRSIRSALMR